MAKPKKLSEINSLKHNGASLKTFLHNNPNKLREFFVNIGFDFDDILDITDFARDDISAVTKEILNKQAEIEEIVISIPTFSNNDAFVSLDTLETTLLTPSCFTKREPC